MSDAGSQRPRLVILISGSGSNLQVFIDRCRDGALDAGIAAVISNRADAYGLQRADDAGIPGCVVDHTRYDSREAFDRALMATINPFAPDAVILAGFMRILTPTFVHHYRGRLLNIHPSLLPRYPGLHTHRRALAAGDTEHGATVHFVTEALDGGPPILQARVPIQPDDTEETLAARVLSKEHCIYPLATRWLLQGRLTLTDEGACLDGYPLPPTGYPYTDGPDPVAAGERRYR